MQINGITRNPKSWAIRYSYQTGSAIEKNPKNRTIVVNSAFKPTRSAAYRYAHDDLVSNAVLTSNKLNDFKFIRINFINPNGYALQNATKQPRGTPAAITQTPYSPHGSAFAGDID